MNRGTPAQLAYWWGSEWDSLVDTQLMGTYPGDDA